MKTTKIKWYVHLFRLLHKMSEIRMNEHYRKMFSIGGMIFGMIFFFTQNVAGQILMYYVNSEQENNMVMAYASFMKPLLLGVSIFIFYCIVGATVFITVGEMFIRFSEYFGIDSRIYRYMVKVKDQTTNCQ